MVMTVVGVVVTMVMVLTVDMVVVVVLVRMVVIMVVAVVVVKMVMRVWLSHLVVGWNTLQGKIHVVVVNGGGGKIEWRCRWW